ncbi:hypothetical protein L915_10169 [Phytophthora nicotianae]|uniref:Uncharacterized protein n=1 Tax=Phytophthora nicotianae TaxID=4792 RepID=W2GPZ1_PHYNI|nr:hypothetical protein L915_10169 [Phytophthora nicotianae]ETL38328.1 hypothetical protein L916_10075 [Phytophthora nicotianae]
MTSLALEGILQAKQFDELNNLNNQERLFYCHDFDTHPASRQN